uniref:Uncharacterized protein n=1 Tax=Caenorhabditis japonica TaxID=281687 RepID=A0A8R1I168_CAEJA
MDYGQPLGLDPPKFCYIPARPLVCGLSLLGIVRGVVFFIIANTWQERTPHFIFVALNALLLFGAARNNEPALKWSQRVVAVCIVLAALQFLILPVMYSSMVASGIADNSTVSFEEFDVFDKQPTKNTMFVRGMLSGYAFEVACSLLIGVQLVKYVLVRRLWMYSKSVEIAGGNQYIVP